MRPDAFAFVMATGVVSIAAADQGFSFLSLSLAVVGAIGMPVLMYVMARRWDLDLRDHRMALPLYTYVAACAVLGARFAEHRWALWVAAGMALQAWLSLTPLVVRSMWRHRRRGLRDDARGGWELVAVATSGLAIVFAGLGWPTVFPLGMYASATYAMALETGWHWFVDVSLVFTWIAVAAWVSVVVRSLRRSRRSPAADTPSDQAT